MTLIAAEEILLVFHNLAEYGEERHSQRLTLPEICWGYISSLDLQFPCPCYQQGTRHKLIKMSPMEPNELNEGGWEYSVVELLPKLTQAAL